MQSASFQQSDLANLSQVLRTIQRSWIGCWDVWLRHFLTRFDQVGTIVSGCGALAMATVKNCLKGVLDTIWWGSDYMLSHVPANNPFITITLC